MPTISSVSHSSIAISDGLGAEQADAAGGERRVVGHDRLAEQRLDDRRGQQVGELLELVAGAERALAGEDDRLRCRR